MAKQQDIPNRQKPVTKNQPGNPKYIPLKKIIEQHEKGYTDAEIAKAFGCDRSNITRRLKPYKEKRQNVMDFREIKSLYIDDLIERITKSVTPEDIKKASLQQKVTSIGILEDKKAQIEGKNNIKIEVEHRLVNALGTARNTDQDNIVEGEIIQDAIENSTQGNAND